LVAVFVVAGLVVALPVVLPAGFAVALFCCEKLSAGILIAAMNNITKTNQPELFPFLM
jgi:hypothetical protein